MRDDPPSIKRSENPDDKPTVATSLPSQARLLPEAIGKYRILRLLGEGGMGVVYEAQQEQPTRTVA